MFEAGKSIFDLLTRSMKFSAICMIFFGLLNFMPETMSRVFGTDRIPPDISWFVGPLFLLSSVAFFVGVIVAVGPKLLALTATSIVHWWQLRASRRKGRKILKELSKDQFYVVAMQYERAGGSAKDFDQSDSVDMHESLVAAGARRPCPFRFKRPMSKRLSQEVVAALEHNPRLIEHARPD